MTTLDYGYAPSAAPSWRINFLSCTSTLDIVSGSQVRMSISMTPEDRALIETAAKAAGVSVSAWIVQTAREEARWAIARQITREMAEEAGVTAEDEAWARSVLGVDGDA
jgi:uncharacterized protein (DUF1778 family)